MREFRVDELAQAEYAEAAGWYEEQRPGLGSELIAEVKKVLVRIARQDEFKTAPLASIPEGNIRREFVARFPYVVVFIETLAVRRVVLIRNKSSDPTLWRSRL